MVESAREVCGSMRAGRKKPKSVWWNDEVKAAIKRKEGAWKKILGGRDEDARERCQSLQRRKEKCIYQSKKEVNEQFGRKVTQAVNRNGK